MRRHTRRAERGGQRGLTLLETVVALVIALIAIEVASGAVVSGLRDSVAGGEVAGAVAVARSRIADLTPEAIAPGLATGTDGIYRWRRAVRALGHVSVPGGAGHAPYAGDVALYAVAVDLEWGSEAHPLTFNLETRTLGPAR